MSWFSFKKLSVLKKIFSNSVAIVSPGSYRHKLLVSFANWTSSKSTSIFSENSLTYKRKIRGPNTVLLWLTKMCSQTSVPNMTNCDLSSRKDINKLTAGSEKLKHSAFLRNILCQNKLNAFARSKKIATVFLPFSWFSFT